MSRWLEIDCALGSYVGQSFLSRKVRDTVAKWKEALALEHFIFILKPVFIPGQYIIQDRSRQRPKSRAVVDTVTSRKGPRNMKKPKPQTCVHSMEPTKDAMEQSYQSETRPINGR